MRAIAGLIVSTVAAVLYGIVCFQFATLDLTVFLAAADNLIEALVLLLVTIMFVPFYWFFVVIGIIVVCLVVTGTVLTGVGKTKAGGIITLVASVVGFLVCWIWYFIPLAVGVVGGILALKEK